MNKIKFERKENIITITLPITSEDKKFCTICGSSSQKGKPLHDILEPRHRVAVLKKITDKNGLCKKCFSSLISLSHKLVDIAVERVPLTHTVELEYAFTSVNGENVLRLLKPDDENTRHLSTFEILDTDPYTRKEYKGWISSVKKYEAYEEYDLLRFDGMYEEQLEIILKDEAILEEIAVKFYLNLQKRIKQ